jgi:hypothetical protein
MANYWISTIWPFVKGDEARACHVFLKDRRKAFPQVGDVVFFRESISVPTEMPTRIAEGNKTQVRVKKGAGGIIARAEVCNEPIKIPPYPQWLVAHEYGNLGEWNRVIRCANHHVGNWLTWKELSRGLKLRNALTLNLYYLKEKDQATIDRLSSAIDH